MDEIKKTIKEWGVSDWIFTEVYTKRGGAIKIYHRLNITGFDFKILQWVETCEDVYRYQLVCHGSAQYDGIRHMYFGENESQPDGCLFYPDPNQLALVFKALSLLEKRFCKESLLNN